MHFFFSPCGIHNDNMVIHGKKINYKKQIKESQLQ